MKRKRHWKKDQENKIRGAFQPVNERAKSTSKRLLGIHVEEEIFYRFRLIAIIENVYVTTILAELIGDFLKSQPKSKLSQLVETVGKMVHDEWKIVAKKRNRRGGYLSGLALQKKFNEFKDKTFDNLRKRKLSEDVIRMILDEFEKVEIEENMK